ncbi:MAG TPA: hypothetical protein VFW39_07450 [Sphingomicrobium sp.]|nr:hypothetical protein [Sphingomicrobium sp.]
MRLGRMLALASISLALFPAQGFAAPKAGIPRVPGTCSFTRIKRIETRLSDGAGHPVPNSGSQVVLENGVYGVSYDTVPEVQHSRPGDRVMTCLVKLPTHCPRGDERGKLYTTTNLRTQESWTLPDAEHYCGGA